jgi:hypothetical protein
MHLRLAQFPARASRAHPTPTAPPRLLRARPAHLDGFPAAAQWCAAAWAAGAGVAPFPARSASPALTRSPRAQLPPPIAPPARRAFTTPWLGAPPRQPAFPAPPALAGPRWVWLAWQPAPAAPRGSFLAQAAPPHATSAALAPSASMARPLCAHLATTQALREPAPAAHAPQAPLVALV